MCYCMGKVYYNYKFVSIHIGNTLTEMTKSYSCAKGAFNNDIYILNDVQQQNHTHANFFRHYLPINYFHLAHITFTNPENNQNLLYGRHI